MEVDLQKEVYFQQSSSLPKKFDHPYLENSFILNKNSIKLRVYYLELMANIAY